MRSTSTRARARLSRRRKWRRTRGISASIVPGDRPLGTDNHNIGQPHLGLRRFISTMASTSAFDGPLGPVRRRLGANSQRYLRRRSIRWKSRNRRRSEHDGRAEHAGRAHEERTHAREDPIRCAELRRPVSRAIENEQLLLDQKRLGDDRPQTAGAHQSSQGGDQVDEQDEQVAHRHILATSHTITKLDTLTGLRG